MSSLIDQLTNRPTDEDGRTAALTAFDKLERASELIEQALQDRPDLKVLQLDPLLRSLAEGMRFLTAKDSELDLPGLMVKHGWRVGQSFFVRATVSANQRMEFVVAAAQEIPEGVRIAAKVPARLTVREGEQVALDVDIKRSSQRPVWRIRAISWE